MAENGLKSINSLLDSYLAKIEKLDVSKRDLDAHAESLRRIIPALDVLSDKMEEVRRRADDLSTSAKQLMLYEQMQRAVVSGSGGLQGLIGAESRLMDTTPRLPANAPRLSTGDRETLGAASMEGAGLPGNVQEELLRSTEEIKRLLTTVFGGDGGDRAGMFVDGGLRAPATDRVGDSFMRYMSSMGRGMGRRPEASSDDLVEYAESARDEDMAMSAYEELKSVSSEIRDALARRQGQTPEVNVTVNNETKEDDGLFGILKSFGFIGAIPWLLNLLKFGAGAIGTVGALYALAKMLNLNVRDILDFIWSPDLRKLISSAAKQAGEEGAAQESTERAGNVIAGRDVLEQNMVEAVRTDGKGPSEASATWGLIKTRVGSMPGPVSPGGALLAATGVFDSLLGDDVDAARGVRHESINVHRMNIALRHQQALRDGEEGYRKSWLSEDGQFVRMFMTGENAKEYRGKEVWIPTYAAMKKENGDFTADEIAGFQARAEASLDKMSVVASMRSALNSLSPGDKRRFAEALDLPYATDYVDSGFGPGRPIVTITGSADALYAAYEKHPDLVLALLRDQASLSLRSGNVLSAGAILGRGGSIRPRGGLTYGALRGLVGASGRSGEMDPAFVKAYGADARIAWRDVGSFANQVSMRLDAADSPAALAGALKENIPGAASAGGRVGPSYATQAAYDAFGLPAPEPTPFRVLPDRVPPMVGNQSYSIMQVQTTNFHFNASMEANSE